MRSAVAAACVLFAACHADENLGNTVSRNVLASDANGLGVEDLHTDADYAYWSIQNPHYFDGGVAGLEFYRVPLAGGTAQLIASVPVNGRSGEFVMDDDFLYLAVIAEPQLAVAMLRIPKSGGNYVILNDSVDEESPIAVDRDFIYTLFLDSTATTSALHAFPKGGGSPAVLTTPYSSPSILVHDKTVYFVDQNQVLVSMPRIGGPLTELALDGEGQLLADNDHLYLARPSLPGDAYANCNGSVTSFAFADNASKTVLDGLCARSFAISSTAIYTLEGSSVVRYGLDGGDALELVNEDELDAPSRVSAGMTSSALFYTLNGGDVVSIDAH